MMHFGKKKVIGGIVFFVVILFLFSIFSGDGDGGVFETAEAVRGDLKEEVSVVGRVKAAERVDLAFERTGRVVTAPADIGESYAQGAVLVQLDGSDILAQLAQAEANVKIQQARLDELHRGSRSEELDIERIKVQSAEVALGEAKTNVLDALSEAHTKSDDAIRNKVDQFINNPRSSTPQIDFSLSNQQLKVAIEQGRTQVESTFSAWAGLSIEVSSTEALILSIGEVKKNLSTIKSFLDNVALAINAVMPQASLSQAEIDAYKADVSAARTNVNTAIAGVSGAEERLKTAESALGLARQELVLKEAGATTEQIVAQEAYVEEARAAVANYQAQLAKTVLRAPITGVVTHQDAKVGQIVSAGNIVVTLISASEFEIETDIPEADIAKIAVGDIASVTLDAYGDEVVFTAMISSIEPAETIIEGVATYTTTLHFTESDPRIRSGMTANLDIVTGERSSVVYIPSRSVLSEDGKRIVRVPTRTGSFEEREVVTGLRGTDGNMEIIEGIEEGEEVIVFIRE